MFGLPVWVIAGLLVVSLLVIMAIIAKMFAKPVRTKR